MPYSSRILKNFVVIPSWKKVSCLNIIILRKLITEKIKHLFLFYHQRSGFLWIRPCLRGPSSIVCPSREGSSLSRSALRWRMSCPSLEIPCIMQHKILHELCGHYRTHWTIKNEFFCENKRIYLKLVQRFHLFSLELGAASTHGTEVDNTATKLDKISTFCRQFDFWHIAQAEVDKILKLFFTHMVEDTLFGRHLKKSNSVIEIKKVSSENIFD